jgi:hypothetical protein
VPITHKQRSFLEIGGEYRSYAAINGLQRWFHDIVMGIQLDGEFRKCYRGGDNGQKCDGEKDQTIPWLSLPEVLILETCPARLGQKSFQEEPWVFPDVLSLKEDDSNEVYSFEFQALVSFSPRQSHFHAHFIANGAIYLHDGIRNDGQAIVQSYQTLTEIVGNEGGDWEPSMAFYRLRGGKERRESFSEGAYQRIATIFGEINLSKDPAKLMEFFRRPEHTFGPHRKILVQNPDAWRAYRDLARPPDYLEYDETYSDLNNANLSWNQLGNEDKSMEGVKQERDVKVVGETSHPAQRQEMMQLDIDSGEDDWNVQVYPDAEHNRQDSGSARIQCISGEGDSTWMDSSTEALYWTLRPVMAELVEHLNQDKDSMTRSLNLYLASRLQMEEHADLTLDPIKSFQSELHAWRDKIMEELKRDGFFEAVGLYYSSSVSGQQYYFRPYPDAIRPGSGIYTRI